jgi:hypothetical protein
VLAALCCTSCQDGKTFYPVTGRLMVDGKPGEGVKIVFHPIDDPESSLLPSAVVAADGSFTLKSWLVEERVLEEGAPAGKYHVTCVWFPADLSGYGAGQAFPDKLHGKYSNKSNSGLEAHVQAAPTELPPFELKSKK